MSKACDKLVVTIRNCFRNTDWGKSFIFEHAETMIDKKKKKQNSKSKQFSELQKHSEEEIQDLAKFPSENPDPILRISKDGTILYSNASGKPVLETWRRKVGEQLPKPFFERVEEAIGSGKVCSFEFNCDRQIFWVTLSPVTDAGYVNFYGTDITERKDTENKLKLHEARLEAMLRLNRMTKKTRQEILDFVREEIIKITQSEFAFIGFLKKDESIMEIENWSNGTMAKCAVIDKPLHFSVSKAGIWAEAIRQRKPVVINDYTQPHPVKRGLPKGHVPIKRFMCAPAFDSGKIVMVAAVANKEKDYDESDVNALTSMMNDTWRLFREKLNEEKIQNLAKFPSENPNPVMRITKEGVLLYANSASELFLNEWGCKVNQIVPDNWQKMVREAFGSGGEKKIETAHLDRTYSFVIAPVTEAGYANLYGRDITNLKRVEREKEYLLTTLKEKKEDLEHFISIIRHDFGNLVLSIQAFGVELDKTNEQLFKFLDEQNIEPKDRDRLLNRLKDDILSSIGFIRSAADQLSKLLEGLRQVASVGHAEINVEQLDINKLIKQITGAMKFQLQDRNVSLIIEQLPNCLGDADQIKQVFTNLLTNAIKYLAPDKKGQIKIYGKIEDDNSIYCVEDNGIGIHPKNHENIFDIFYQVDSSNPAGGEGLGLQIVVKILERLNGRIWIDSELGKGSKFFVSLPSV